MTILATVGLIQLASITIKADTTSDILNAYSYRYYIVDFTGNYHVWLSNQEIRSVKARIADIELHDLNLGVEDKLENTTSHYFYASPYYNNNKPIILNYNGGVWEIEIPMYDDYRYYTLTASSAIVYTGWIFARQDTITTFSSSAPSGFPVIDLNSGVTLDQVQTEIDTALNATTNITTQAKNIQTQVTNNYISYSNGEINLSTLQANINNLAQQLENLNNSSGATISDKIAINNAITQTQLVQDAANKDQIIQEMEQDLTVSSSVSATITGKINQANQAFNNYSQGSTTQTEAVTQINQYITQLTQLITPQTPTADINAINAAIDTINGIKDSVASHSDLDDSVSESAQNSDKEELEYLEDIEAETTDDIDSLKSKVDNTISESQANQVKNNVIAPILQNTLIVKLLPIAALFMVLAVTLGFKYRL